MFVKGDCVFLNIIRASQRVGAFFVMQNCTCVDFFVIVIAKIVSMLIDVLLEFYNECRTKEQAGTL